ncbi:MAG: extracellular solute-binding protein [Halalkalicoccus sp.]
MTELSKRSFMRTAGAGAVAGLAGCLGLGGGDDEGLSFWAAFWNEDHHSEFQEWYAEEIEELTGQPPELTDYQYDDLQEQVITGGRTGTPDVIEGVIEHPADYVNGDLVEPLTDRMDELYFLDGYTDAALEAFEFQGEQWALPYVGNGRALVYRKDVLAEYGYEDGPPEEAAEFLELAHEIYEGEDGMSGFHFTTERGEVRQTQEFLSHVYQHVDGLFAEADGGWELQADADIFAGVLDMYYELYLGELQAVDTDARGAGWEQNDEGYTRGEHAMIQCGPWITMFDDTEAQEEVLYENTGIAHLPYTEGGERSTYMEVKPVMLNAHSERLEEAWEALELFIRPETVDRYGQGNPGEVLTPVHEGIESTLDDADFEPFIEVFETGVPPAQIRWGSVRQPIYDAIENVLYEERTPEEAAEDLEGALRDLEGELTDD